MLQSGGRLPTHACVWIAAAVLEAAAWRDNTNDSVLSVEQSSSARGTAPVVGHTAGVAFSLLSNVLSAVGMVLLRRSHLLRPCRSDGGAAAGGPSGEKLAAGSPCHEAGRWWLAGFAIYILAMPFDVAGYAFAPQIVCTIAGVTKVALTALLGSLVLQEVLTKLDIAGITLCMAGNAAMVYSAPEAHTHRAGDAGQLFTPEVIWFLAWAVPAAAVLIATDLSFDPERLPPVVRRFILPLITAVVYGIEKVFNSMLGSIELPEAFRDAALPAAVLLPLGALGLTALFFNLRGAKRHCVTEFVPATFVFGACFQVATGIAVLKERWQSRPAACVAAAGGLAALAGVMLVRPAGPGHPKGPPLGEGGKGMLR